MDNKNDIIIREFDIKDRAALRKMSYDTAFMGESGAIFFSDEEILTDILTLYFTDYEPSSCFVAVNNNKIIGYLTGAKSVMIMRRILNIKIIPRIFMKSLSRGLFFRKKVLFFLLHYLISFLKRELFVPDFTCQYPATLHINVDKNFRRREVGKKLIEYYLSFLKTNNITGVHFCTCSKQGRYFFIKNGFNLLFMGKRSYWRSYSDRYFPYYVFGKIL